MTKQSNRRPPFDPRLKYVAGPRGLKLNGTLLEPGAPVEPPAVTPRRLRQLYDARHVVLAAGQTVPKPEPRRSHVQVPQFKRGVMRRLSRRAAA